MITITNPAQYERAKWYEKNDRTGDYKLIPVEVVSESEKRYSTLLQNLVTNIDNTVLKTDYPYDYKPTQIIFYRDRWWEIVSVGERTLELNPQAMSLVKPTRNLQKVIELIEVD